MESNFDDREKQKLLLQNFMKRLNADPNPAEFQPTPDGKANVIPISYVEMTLDEIFLGQWDTRNFTWSAITNEVQGKLELVVVNPITGRETVRTGAASIIITVDSLSQEEKNGMTKQARNLFALDPQNKKPNALDLGFPKLKAECVKNAAQSLGKVFGRDINRKHVDAFKPALRALPDEALLAAIKRAEGGEIGVLELVEANFIVDKTQLEMISNAQNRTKQLN